MIIPALPVTPVFLDEFECWLGVNIANQDDDSLLRTIPAVEEQGGVLHLIGHCLDILDKSHRRVLVCVHREHHVTDPLEHL